MCRDIFKSVLIFISSPPYLNRIVAAFTVLLNIVKAKARVLDIPEDDNLIEGYLYEWLESKK